jgi:pentapeptide MXKDX repeat protein
MKKLYVFACSALALAAAGSFIAATAFADDNTKSKSMSEEQMKPQGMDSDSMKSDDMKSDDSESDQMGGDSQD